ncbi:Rap1a/Tai family immunity protein [Devosia sp.]|uniref:Rap1a/Tai family immunity protein n=1 Tax=Devosia sp. TaxID=1871048 RepID=UPI0019E487E3|nr:Rap1a/Tai family immunity protein [Devosia sp.]MBE0582059.1 hypothetical protein [Devosia sp.]
MSRLLSAVLVLLLMPGSVSLAFDQGAAGWFHDGNELLEQCDGAPSLAEAYVMGIADGTQYGGENAENYRGYRYCSPQGATSRQYRDLACTYVEDHPERRQEPGATLIMEALFSAWPCLGHR